MVVYKNNLLKLFLVGQRIATGSFDYFWATDYSCNTFRIKFLFK